VFVCSNFAKQVVEVERKKRPPIIYVGNLEARRDFTDVRDMVYAYWLSTEKCEPGEVYNICSGTSISIQELLNLVLSNSDIEIEVRQDPSRLRPSDVPLLEGDSTRFREATGWAPKIPFRQTLSDMMDYWRDRIR
jgi:GDP-4-dehydro-6-deoxy-D-mannose reductase